MTFKIVNGLAPPYLTEMFTSNNALNNYGLNAEQITIRIVLLSVASRSGMLSLATSKKKDLWKSLKEAYYRHL